MVAACSIDRLGRSVQNLIAALNELVLKDLNFYLHKQRHHTGESAKKIVRDDHIGYQVRTDIKYKARNEQDGPSEYLRG